MRQSLYALFAVSLFSGATLVGVGRAGADLSRSAQKVDVKELQRRIKICLSAENWLKIACFEALQTMGHDRVRNDTPGHADTSNPMASPKAKKDDPVTAAPAKFDEMHMVGIYEARTRYGSDGQVLGRDVQINVNRPGKSVALVLGSYEPIRWIVKAGPDTIVSRVMIGGHGALRSRAVVNGAPVEAERGNLPLAYSSVGKRFQPFHAAASLLTGAEHADSFHGAYKAPRDGFTIDAAPGVATEEEEGAKLDALAIGVSALPKVMRAALDDPAAFPAGQWKFSKTGFTGVNQAGESVSYDISLDVPRVSWPTGAAYDPKTQRLWGVTFGGEGYLYEYDIRTRQWTAWSMNGFDAGGLLFDGETGRLVATPGRHLGYKFVIMTTKAKVLFDLPIRAKDYPGLINSYDPGNGPRPAMVPIAIKDGKILVRADNRRNFGKKRANARLYLVNLRTGKVDLVR